MPNLSVSITGPSAAVGGAFTVRGDVSEGDPENGIGNPSVKVTLPNGNVVSASVAFGGSWSLATAVPAGLRGADTFVISVTASWTLPKVRGQPTQTQTDSDSRTFVVLSVNPPRLTVTSGALADPPSFLDAHSTNLPMPFTIAGTMTEGDARIFSVNYAIDTSQWFQIPSTSGAWATWQQSFSLSPGYHRIRIQAIDRANLQANLEKWIFVHSNPDPVDNHTGSITSWTRLEPHVRSPDMGRTVSARLFDPVWMMTRQWQMGEFQGEDTGSPISARIRATNAPVTRYALGQIPASAMTATPYDATRTPLETVVERRVMRPATMDDPRMLSFVVDAGLHFLHMLDQAGTTKSYRTAFAAKFALPQLPTPAPYAVDEAAQRFAQVMAGRAPDARRLAAAFRSGGSASVVTDATLQIVTADQTKVKTAADAWLIWYDSVVTEPTSATDDGWNPSRLEYSVSVAGALSATAADEVTLSAAEIDDGRLDWSNFDVNVPAKLGSAGDQPVTSLVETTIPSPVSFRGMPAMRFWELEDSKISYGLMSVGPTDLAHLMMIEYAGSYGNDWFTVPLSVPVGSLTRVDSLVVTDTFGIQRLQRPLGAAGVPATNFAMWQQSVMRRSGDPFSLAASLPAAVPNLFFLPPSLGRVEEGGAIEDVVVMRDQMANMAWAVERVVENPIEQPSARAYDLAPAPESSAVAGVSPRYVLASTVPDNWIPLVPVRAQQTSGPDQLWLQRAVLLQPDAAGTKLNQSHSEALATAGKLRIYDEEVPREGARITRSRRLARWSDGSFWVWSAFRRQTGNGEGSSGLEYDRLHGAGGSFASAIAPPPPVLGPPSLTPASLKIGGSAGSYSATLNHSGPGLLNVTLQVLLIQGTTQRTLIDAFIDCGAGAGAVPTGASSLSGQISIATGEAAILQPGPATLLVQLTQESNVIAVSPGVPLTILSNAPVPSLGTITAQPATANIEGPTSGYSVTVTNPGPSKSNIVLQGWMNQGTTRRAAGGAMITCGSNPLGVLPNGTFTVSGFFSASSSSGGAGSFVNGPATFELQLIESGTVIATQTLPVTLRANVAGFVSLSVTNPTIAIGSSGSYVANLRNPGITQPAVSVQGWLNQGATRRDVGGKFLALTGQTIGALPPGSCSVTGTFPLSTAANAVGVLVPGPATFELQLTVIGTVFDTIKVPVTLV